MWGAEIGEQERQRNQTQVAMNTLVLYVGTLNHFAIGADHMTILGQIRDGLNLREGSLS